MSPRVSGSAVPRWAVRSCAYSFPLLVPPGPGSSALGRRPALVSAVVRIGGKRYIAHTMTRHSGTGRSNRPLVAVSATVRTEDAVDRLRLTAAYLQILEQASLVPVVLPPLGSSSGQTTAAVGRVLDVVDGLVLTGGEDVDPGRYGAAPSAHLGAINRARDACEIAAVLGARERALPTLAICRGIQVLNVALGGTLIQDIPSEWPNAVAH